MPSTRFLIAIATVAAGAICAAVLLIRGGEASDRDNSPSRSNPAQRAEAELVKRGLRGLDENPHLGSRPLAIMRGKPEAIPGSVRRAIAETIGPAPRLDLRYDESQYALTPSGAGVWLIAGKGVICMFEALTANSSCLTTTLAAKRGILLGLSRPAPGPSSQKQFKLEGIAPDGATAVVVRVGHRTRVLATRNHLYSLQTTRPPVVTRFIQPKSSAATRSR